MFTYELHTIRTTHLGNVGRAGDLVVVCLDLAVGGGNVVGLKRWPSNQHCVQNAPDRPDVNLVAVALLAVQNLGRNVVGCAAQCSVLKKKKNQMVV